MLLDRSGHLITVAHDGILVSANSVDGPTPDGLIESDLQKLARTGRSLLQNEFQDLRVHFPHNLLARHLIKTLSQTGRNPAYTRAEFRNELTEEILVGLQNAVDQPARCSLGRPSSPFHAATANVPDQIDQRLALKERCGASPLFPTQQQCLLDFGFDSGPPRIRLAAGVR